MILDHTLHQNNLKFKGIPTDANKNIDLIAFMAGWIASELQLEGIILIITKATRIGTPNNS